MCNDVIHDTCGNEIPDLTEEESQRIGEYAAVTLLKYDANNRSRLVDPEVVIAKLEKEAAKEASQEEEKRKRRVAPVPRK